MQSTSITKKYVRKPLFVDAVQVTEENFWTSPDGVSVRSETSMNHPSLSRLKRGPHQSAYPCTSPQPEELQADQGVRR